MGERHSAIVTGASGAIGAAAARVLAGRGFELTLTGRNPDRLAEAAGDLTAAGAAAVRTDAVDLRDPAASDAVVAGHRVAFGVPSVLVAAAGSGTAAPIVDTDEATLARNLDLNVSATFAMVRPTLAAMLEAGEGWIVPVASLAGIHPTKGAAAYSAAKAALVSLARSINLDHAGEGVRACALCPGFVESAMTEWVRDRVPAETMLRPDDVAAGIEMLLSLSPTAVIDEIVLRRRDAAPHEP